MINMGVRQTSYLSMLLGLFRQVSIFVVRQKTPYRLLVYFEWTEKLSLLITVAQYRSEDLNCNLHCTLYLCSVAYRCVHARWHVYTHTGTHICIHTIRAHTHTYPLTHTRAPTERAQSLTHTFHPHPSTLYTFKYTHTHA